MSGTTWLRCCTQGHLPLVLLYSFAVRVTNREARVW